MKYIEELKAGDCFKEQENYYIVTCDFTKKTRFCISLVNGTPRWFSNETIINNINIYTLDENNHTIPIKYDT